MLEEIMATGAQVRRTPGNVQMSAVWFANYGFSRYSMRSFAFAASLVCHCMLPGVWDPPCFSAWMWSTTYPGHAPDVRPVEGHGLERRNSLRTAALRLIRPRLLRAHPTHFDEACGARCDSIVMNDLSLCARTPARRPARRRERVLGIAFYSSLGCLD